MFDIGSASMSRLEEFENGEFYKETFISSKGYKIESLYRHYNGDILDVKKTRFDESGRYIECVKDYHENGNLAKITRYFAPDKNGKRKKKPHIGIV